MSGLPMNLLTEFLNYDLLYFFHLVDDLRVYSLLFPIESNDEAFPKIFDHLLVELFDFIVWWGFIIHKFIIFIRIFLHL